MTLKERVLNYIKDVRAEIYTDPHTFEKLRVLDPAKLDEAEEMARRLFMLIEEAHEQPKGPPEWAKNYEPSN